jgi:hypothetical protein
MNGRQKESKQAPANTTVKTRANTTRRQRQTAIVPNSRGNSTKPKNTTIGKKRTNKL